jgi:ubiquitin-activating enzyme E1
VGSDAASGWDVEAKAQALTAQLPSQKELAGFRLAAVEFEKDDDLHIALVSSVANLRARNYAIAEVDVHSAKQIAGKIIPAIATTTAMVTGLICLELYKLLGDKPIEAFRNCYANLAVPHDACAFSEPVAVKTNRLLLPPEAKWSPPPLPGARAGPAPAGAPREWRWSVWDRIDVRGPLTMRQLREWVRENLGLDASQVSVGSTALWAPYLKPKQQRERLDLDVAVLFEKVSQTKLESHQRRLVVETMLTHPETGDDVETPYIRYHL